MPSVGGGGSGGGGGGRSSALVAGVTPVVRASVESTPGHGRPPSKRRLPLPSAGWPPPHHAVFGTPPRCGAALAPATKGAAGTGCPGRGCARCVCLAAAHRPWCAEAAVAAVAVRTRRRWPHAGVPTTGTHPAQARTRPCAVKAGSYLSYIGKKSPQQGWLWCTHTHTRSVPSRWRRGRHCHRHHCHHCRCHRRFVRSRRAGKRAMNLPSPPSPRLVCHCLPSPSSPLGVALAESGSPVGPLHHFASFPFHQYRRPR